VRNEDGDSLTVPEEELELAADTLSYFDIQLYNAHNY
jgi:hypothetical protein